MGGMEKEKTFLERVRAQKWVLPLGLALLILMWAAGIAFCFVGGLDRLEPDWIFNVGADVVGVAICAVLYYGCMSGKDSTQETTYLFVTLLSLNGFALFLDECAWMVQGVAALRLCNLVVNVLFYANGVLLIYQFWRYVRSALQLNDEAMQRAAALLRLALLPASLLCWSNLFVPLYFSVDEQGVYCRAAFYPLCFAYTLLCIIVLLAGILRSNVSKRQRNVVVSFAAIPILNAVLTYDTFGISTQYVATLISVVLIYSVVYADRSKTLAATEAELSTAAGIQTHMLPNVFPPFPERGEFDIYATMEPAKEVGGDFYDFFLIGEDRLGMVVADVSGKGVPAALFSMIAKTMLKTQTQTWINPEYVLRDVNASLSENNEEDMFVTVWLGVLDISTGELTYANAGHEKLLLYQDGAWKFLPNAGGVALAMYEPEDLECLDEKYRFHNRTVKLRPGDAIFQYTDGVTEAMNTTGALFGDERLLEAMNSAPSIEPEKLLPHVRARIDAFVKGAPQFDDITMLGLTYHGAKDGA